jgi:hypothetical protein
MVQAATDPEFPNKWPGSSLPRLPTNLDVKYLIISLEKLQLANVQSIFKKIAVTTETWPRIRRFLQIKLISN